jgi:GxxExxY protein
VVTTAKEFKPPMNADEQRASKPPMNADERRSDGNAFLDDLTERVLGAVLEVSNVLGAGFLEKVYQRALLREFSLRGLQAKSEVPYPVCYKGQCIGEYLADIVVEDQVVVELKCADSLAKEHVAQCINYLKVSGRKVALLVNFQRPKVEWKRVVYEF